MTTKALLVGINEYTDQPLLGCVNDVLDVRTFLTEHYHIPESDIRVLLDKEATTANISTHLRWLAAADDSGESGIRLFHFSGHGMYIADQNGDEPDGRDECLVPIDYLQIGPMRDDTLREIYGSFDPKTHLVLVMDCCHSGTNQRDPVREVRYRFLPTTWEEEQKIRSAKEATLAQRKAYVKNEVRDLLFQEVAEDEFTARVMAAMESFDKKHFGQETVPGNTVLIAGCRDDQKAADAKFGERYQGAMTHYLLDTLQASGDRPDYRTLIEEVGRKLYSNGYTQEPQLECDDALRTGRYLLGTV